jgi:signal transduction histidine kinase
MVSAFDIITYKQYILQNHYFNSDSYYNDLSKYFENLRALINQQTNTSDPQYTKNKNILDSNTFVKYYVKNRNNGDIYTNYENSSDSDNIKKEQLLYEETFVKDSNTPYRIRTIDNWFKANNFEGKFIFLKNSDGYSQMEKNYKYFQSKRARVLKEGLISILTFIIGTSILLSLRNFFKDMLLKLAKIRTIYEKIPLDLRLLIFFIYYVMMTFYFKRTIFFYTPIGLIHLIKLTFVGVYVVYLILNLLHTIALFKDRELISSQWKKLISYRIIALLKESFKAKGILFKAGVIFFLTTFLGLFVFLALFGIVQNEDTLFFISAFYIIVYTLFVPIYILKRIVSVDKIIKATDEIALGNLDYFIEDKGNGTLSRLANNINNMKTGFKNSVDNQLKSERLKTELITNVSHDLKTPLTSIINYVSLLKKGGISEEQSSSYIEVLEQKSQRLKILIEDLFEASKVSSGSIELNLESVDIVSLLQQTLGESHEKITNSSLTFKVNIPSEEIFLLLDGKRTWRVFENLINNALKYSQPSSRVYIDLIQNNEKVIVTMKNMSSYEMDFDVEEIFDRFKRGDKARVSEGSGLGLSIAKSIVELQGGNMHISIDGDLFKITVEFKK